MPQNINYINSNFTTDASFPQDTAIVSKNAEDRCRSTRRITAIDLRLLHKYMDVYSRPPDRSVGRFKLGTVQMQLAHKPTARYLVAPQTEIRSTLQACLCRLHHRKSISGYCSGSRASTKTLIHAVYQKVRTHLFGTIPDCSEKGIKFFRCTGIQLKMHGTLQVCST
jgi:hypothetical protein